MTQTQMRRRRFVGRGAAVVVLLALFATSCASTSSTDETTTTVKPSPSSVPPTTAAETPQKPYGGEVVIGLGTAPGSLNPFLPDGQNLETWRIVAGVYTGVYDVEADTQALIPDVVDFLPTERNGGITINPDGTMTVRYEIRDDAVWGDGVSISGDDFGFTLDTLLDLGDEAYAEIDPASVVAGPKSIEFTMSAPTLQVQLLFGVLIPKHAVEGSDFVEDWNDKMWLSGGPYVFESWDGMEIRLARNESFWKTDFETGQALPYLDAVTFRFHPEDETRGSTELIVAALEAREVDFAVPAGSSATVAFVNATGSIDGVETEPFNGPRMEHLAFQFGEGVDSVNPDSLNEHLAYRQAVAYAIDKNRIVAEVFDGVLPPLDSYVDVFDPTLSTEAWDRYPYDPDLARSLLADLCTELGRDCVARPPRAVVTGFTEIRIEVASLIVEMLSDIGIDAELRETDFTEFLDIIDFGTWDIMAWAWFSGPGLANLIPFHDVFDPQGPPLQGQNFYRWGTPAVSGSEDPRFDQEPSSVIDAHTARFEEIVVAMNQTLDSAMLRTLVTEAEQLLSDQVAMVPLYPAALAAAWWPDEIGGVRPSSADTETWNIGEWYRVDLGSASRSAP